MQRSGEVKTCIFCGNYVSEQFNTWTGENPNYLILSVDYKMVQDATSIGRTHHSIFVVYKTSLD